MHNYSAVYVFFRFLNFGIFVALFVYAYYRYLKPNLMQQEAAEQSARRKLAQQIAASEELIVEKQALSQKAVGEGKRLISSVESWVAYKKEQSADKESVFYKRMQAIKDRNKKMAACYADEQVRQMVKPLIIQEIQAELSEQLASEDAQKEYLNKSIRALYK